MTIVGMQKDEKNDCSIEGLNYNVRVDLLRAQEDSFKECACLALNVDSAFWRAEEGTQGASYTSRSSESGPTPMEIGNVQSCLIPSLQPSTGRERRIQKRTHDLPDIESDENLETTIGRLTIRNSSQK